MAVGFAGKQMANKLDYPKLRCKWTGAPAGSAKTLNFSTEFIRQIFVNEVNESTENDFVLVDSDDVCENNFVISHISLFQ